MSVEWLVIDGCVGPLGKRIHERGRDIARPAPDADTRDLSHRLYLCAFGGPDGAMDLVAVQRLQPERQRASAAVADRPAIHIINWR